MQYYSRQMVLAEVGLQGQQFLKDAKCLVVGAGGLGASALLYLAAAGIGKIGICDGDRLEESNLHRQPIYSVKEIGELKANVAALRLKELNPHIEVVSYPFRLVAENAPLLFPLYDVVLDCTDNFRTKFLINDAAYLFQKILVRASIYQFEGQIQTYIPQRGDACLRCLWEQVPQEGCVGTCQQVGVLGPVPGYFGILQAMEAIKFFLKMPTLGMHEILFNDLIHYTQRSISFKRTTSCLLCGENPTIKSLIEKEPWEVHRQEIEEGAFTWVDIREPKEIAVQPYPGVCLKMPLSRFDASRLDSSSKYLFFCQRGMRSARLVRSLREQGMTQVFSLIGGMASFFFPKGLAP